jgi:hypothetical protein
MANRTHHAGSGKVVLPYSSWDRPLVRRSAFHLHGAVSALESQISTRAKALFKMQETHRAERRLMLALIAGLEHQFELPLSREVGWKIKTLDDLIINYELPLSKLKSFKIENLGMISFPEKLAAALPRLTHLYASGNNFRVFPPSLIPNLQTLEHIDFGSTNFDCVYDVLNTIASQLNEDRNFIWIELDQLKNVFITRTQAKRLKKLGFSLRHVEDQGQPKRVAFDYLCTANW